MSVFYTSDGTRGQVTEALSSDSATSGTICPPDWDGVPTWKREAEVYKDILPGLIKSIVDYMNKITDPMSASLVQIKTSMRDFMAQVHSNDEEIINHKSLDRVNAAVSSLKGDINQVADETAEAFNLFGKEFQRLKDLLASIFRLTGNISEIAERVHVLSINASIESARAGIHGRGFKVIAGEIQKLAHETQVFVKDIGGTVQTSRDIFGSIEGEISRNQQALASLVDKERGTFNQLDSAISSQHSQFSDLYKGILKFIDGFEGDMKTIFPMAMLHAIIIQEIENFQKVTMDFLGVMDEIFENRSEVSREFAFKDTLDRVRNRLTTARELDVLEATVKRFGMQGQVDMKRDRDDYELF